MTQDEIIEMVKQAEILEKGDEWVFDMSNAFELTTNQKQLEAFAKLIAEKEREVVANWIMDRGFATGHGDSIVDLLDQLEWQIAEKEREACAQIAIYGCMVPPDGGSPTEDERLLCEHIAHSIRARGQA